MTSGARNYASLLHEVKLRLAQWGTSRLSISSQVDPQGLGVFSSPGRRTQTGEAGFQFYLGMEDRAGTKSPHVPAN